MKTNDVYLTVLLKGADVEDNLGRKYQNWGQRSLLNRVNGKRVPILESTHCTNEHHWLYLHGWSESYLSFGTWFVYGDVLFWFEDDVLTCVLSLISAILSEGPWTGICQRSDLKVSCAVKHKYQICLHNVQYIDIFTDYFPHRLLCAYEILWTWDVSWYGLHSLVGW